MSKRDLDKTLRCICHHGKILLRGLGRTAYSAMVAGLLGMAVMAFAAIPGEQGYAAVQDFVAGTATAMMAMICIYCSGCHCRRKERK